jgi:DNA-binding response OmpR family regulator
MANKRVLIVDDALELGRLLKATLNTLNKDLEVMVVPSAEEAYLEADKNPIDLLITDYRLPGVTGADLLKRIRAKTPKLKVILITGLTDNQLPQQGKDLLVDFFLKKPMEIEEFLEASRKCLGISESGRLMEKVPEESEPGNLLREILKDLKGNINAVAVALVDEEGKVLLKEGEFPEKNFEGKWLPAILGAVAADAKVLHLFPTPVGDGLHAYMGPAFHLVFISLNENTLMAVLKPEQGHNHLLMALGVVIDTQRELIKKLTNKGAKPMPIKEGPKAREKTPVAATEKKEPAKAKNGQELSEFEVKINKAAPRLKTEDLDRFWETGEQEEQSGGDGITFEEARKMGLVEKDKNKAK